jgi:hypothetical protein
MSHRHRKHPMAESDFECRVRSYFVSRYVGLGSKVADTCYQLFD